MKGQLKKRPAAPKTLKYVAAMGAYARIARLDSAVVAGLKLVKP